MVVAVSRRSCFGCDSDVVASVLRCLRSTTSTRPFTLCWISFVEEEHPAENRTGERAMSYRCAVSCLLCSLWLCISLCLRASLLPLPMHSLLFCFFCVARCIEYVYIYFVRSDTYPMAIRGVRRAIQAPLLLSSPAVPCFLLSETFRLCRQRVRFVRVARRYFACWSLVLSQQAVLHPTSRSHGLAEVHDTHLCLFRGHHPPPPPSK
ncbi:unnamed protein product, partial [Ectocarpus sp. 12 AP-2014]